MKLELITLTGPKFEEDVYEVSLPTPGGIITILPHHMALVTLAVPGVIAIRRHKGDQEIERYATNGGVIEVDENKVRLLVDEADHSNEIVEAEARAALERAKQAKKDAKSQVELSEAQTVIDREAVRLKVAELRRRNRPPRA
jgi:F-type H+-transporting ATPase subunit epsilon